MSNSSKYHFLRGINDDPPDILLDGLSPSSSRPSFNINPSGEIQHGHQLAEQIGQLLFNENCSDITLVVEGTRIPAHKVILSARSTYFWAMFYGGMRESTASEVCLEDTSAQAFRVLLKYIYCGRIQLGSMNFDLIIDVLGLVHKYGFLELEIAIADYLKSVLNQRSACLIYSAAYLYSISALVATCLDYFDNYALETLESPGFLLLEAPALILLIERNSFCAPELEIFKAVQRWINAHPEASQSSCNMLSKVRLALIKLEDLLNVVRPTNLISPEALLDAINEQNKTKSSDLVYRGFMMPNVNIATAEMGAKIVAGELPTALLASGTCPFKKSAHTTVGTSADHGTIFELGSCFIINLIQIFLYDRDQRMYSYFVEVSIDRNDWIRVADYSHYLCRARQKNFFDERVVKYIRVMGVNNCNTIQGRFNLVALEAMYSTELFEVDTATKLLIPHDNVATIPNNAIVVEGVSRSRNALLNGDTQNYDWDNGYTCHELGSSSIIVQLPQPYLIDSMRLLLWDCDDRTYSFYIEVSIDRVNWTKIVEVQQGRSWQTLRFKRTTVVFVKIVGTYNSANEVFHCVHFECPATISKEEEELEIQQKKVQIQIETEQSKPSTSTNANEKCLMLMGAESNDVEEIGEISSSNIGASEFGPSDESVAVSFRAPSASSTAAVIGEPSNVSSPNSTNELLSIFSELSASDKNE